MQTRVGYERTNFYKIQLYHYNRTSTKKEDTAMTENNKKRVSIEVEPDFHRELKLFATLRGMTLQNYITTLIKNDMKNMK